MAKTTVNLQVARDQAEVFRIQEMGIELLDSMIDLKSIVRQKFLAG